VRPLQSNECAGRKTALFGGALSTSLHVFVRYRWPRAMEAE
jgi:hypothetical protein